MQDALARFTEVDEFARGAAGERHQVPTPVNAVLLQAFLATRGGGVA